MPVMLHIVGLVSKLRICIFHRFSLFTHSDRSRSALSNDEVFKFPLLTVKKLLNFENNRI